MRYPERPIRTVVCAAMVSIVGSLALVGGLEYGRRTERHREAEARREVDRRVAYVNNPWIARHDLPPSITEVRYVAGDPDVALRGPEVCDDIAIIGIPRRTATMQGGQQLGVVAWPAGKETDGQMMSIGQETVLLPIDRLASPGEVADNSGRAAVEINVFGIKACREQTIGVVAIGPGHTVTGVQITEQGRTTTASLSGGPNDYSNLSVLPAPPQ